MKRTRSRWIGPSVKRSSYEDKIIASLDAEDIEYGYETEKFPYVVEHLYIPDFVFPQTRILVEAKGYFTPEDRGKILKARPAIDESGWELRFVFQRAANKLNKNSKTTYGKWCDRHGFVWAEGLIPSDWYS
jgi:predicted nuclease of restriction endonuclease-like RecB superfamily